MIKWKRGFVFLLAAALLCTSAAGCGQKSVQSQAANSGGSVSVQTSGKKQDQLVYAGAADARGLDPALVDDIESVKVMCNIYEGLLKYDKDTTNVKPALAESWEVSKDGLTYIFHLRKGVKFQDGTDFNAEAVKMNIDRQLPPQATEDMGYASFVYGSVKSVEAVDENTVKINMKTPCTPFLNNLAMNISAPIVSPKALKEHNNNVNETPCGTGPYKFVRWDKDQSIILTRNDNYWGNQALIKDVVFKTIKDNSSRVVALNNGEADVIDGIDATVADQITSAGNQLYKAQGMNTNYMAYNTSRAPFKDAKVRTAVSAAINVPEMVKSLYKDYAEAATTFLPSFMPGYDKTVSQVKYDPQAAAAVLKAAGITKIHMITYSSARQYNTANGQVLAEAVQGYLSKVGITCTIDTFDWTTYKTKQKEQDYDICFAGWIGDNGDPDNFLNLFASEEPSLNYSHYKDTAYNKLIEEAAAAPAGDARNVIYGQCEKIIAEQAPILPISHATTLCAYRPAVHGFYSHMTGMTPLAGVSKDT